MAKVNYDLHAKGLGFWVNGGNPLQIKVFGAGNAHRPNRAFMLSRALDLKSDSILPFFDNP